MATPGAALASGHGARSRLRWQQLAGRVRAHRAHWISRVHRSPRLCAGSVPCRSQVLTLSALRLTVKRRDWRQARPIPTTHAHAHTCEHTVSLALTATGAGPPRSRA